jgi:hypothetical protein
MVPSVLPPVTFPPVTLPPVIVPSVLPPVTVPVVELSVSLVVTCRTCGLTLVSETAVLLAVDVPLWLLMEVVPSAFDGLDVSPSCWFTIEQDCVPSGQLIVSTWAAAGAKPVQARPAKSAPRSRFLSRVPAAGRLKFQPVPIAMGPPFLSGILRAGWHKAGGR